MRKGRVYIGTSGWHYEHWVGPFYPEGTPSDEFFAFYKKHFSTTEINNSFYQLPGKSTVADWRKQAPEGFLYAVKASRYITHMKKLKDPKQATEKFFNHMTGLGNKFGPILFQLPPNWKVNEERLENFLNVLPPQYRYAFELRDNSWITEKVKEILSKYNAAFVIYDFAGRSTPLWVTADFVYVRLHGPAEQAYQGNYSEQELKFWADKTTEWRGKGLDVFCYFDNDQAGYAPKNAASLISMA